MKTYYLLFSHIHGLGVKPTYQWVRINFKKSVKMFFMDLKMTIISFIVYMINKNLTYV